MTKVFSKYNALAVILCPLFSASGASAQEGASSVPPMMKPCGPEHGPLITQRSFAVPARGAENEVEIGESMISTTQSNVMQGPLVLTRDAHFVGTYAGASYEVTIPAGKLLAETTKRGLSYTSPRAVFKYNRDNKPRNGLGKPEISLMFDTEEPTKLNGLVGFGFTTKITPINDAAYSSDNCLILGEDGFRRELLYSGLSKGTITLEYREFVNNFARPAFSQEIRYDLSDGNEIGFKGARFQIIKASNTSIRYKVVKPLD